MKLLTTIGKPLCALFAAVLLTAASAPAYPQRDHLRGLQVEHSSHAPVGRDKDGKLKRSSSVTRRFKKLTGYPNGRPGYQIDHIRPLKRGGPDCVCNLQWLTIERKKVKDRLE